MELSPQLAEIHKKGKDAWHGAKALWSYVTIVVPCDPEKKTRPAREVAWRANILQSKVREAGTAHQAKPLWLVEAADGDDAHAIAIGYAATVLSAIPNAGEAYNGKRLDTCEMVHDFRNARYTEESIAQVWADILAGFALIEPPDEALLTKMEAQIAKAERLRRQMPQGGDDVTPTAADATPRAERDEGGSKDAPYSCPANYERDKWIYDNIAKYTCHTLSHKLRGIVKTKKWILISSRNGFKKAADRYADFHGLEQRRFPGE